MTSTVTAITMEPNLLQQLSSVDDPRTQDWDTLRNPMYIIVLLSGYLYMAKIWGPNFMKDRKPYGLKRVIQFYNLVQVAANVYFSSRIAYIAFVRLGYSAKCQSLSYSRDEATMELLNNLYFYLLVRVSDFFDTLFFILKKKFTHVSQLHVIHHTMVVFNGWLYMRLGSDGQTIVSVITNSVIHIIMYSYYFLATLGPNVQKYLWWKKYLTTLQIVQFVVLILHGLIPMFVDCGYPKILIIFGLPQGLLILGLFINFYIQSYTSGNSLKHRSESNNLAANKLD